MFDSADRGWDAHLVLGAVVVLVALALEAYTVVFLKQPFDVQGFGVGIGAVLTAVGLAGAGQGVQRRLQGDTAPVPATTP